MAKKPLERLIYGYSSYKYLDNIYTPDDLPPYRSVDYALADKYQSKENPLQLEVVGFIDYKNESEVSFQPGDLYWLQPISENLLISKVFRFLPLMKKTNLT